MTICAHNRVNHFGEIDNDQMKLSGIGQIASDCWQHIPEHFENTALDEFVVMPNHIHGIIITVGTQICVPYNNKIPTNPDGPHKAPYNQNTL